MVRSNSLQLRQRGSATSWVLSVFGLRAAEALTRTRVWSLYNAMLRFDRARRDSQRQVNRRRLRRIMLHAAEHVPYWRSRELGQRSRALLADSRDPVETLRRLPTLTKKDLFIHFDACLSETGERADWRFQTSAGTTERIDIVYDFRKRDHVRAAEFRAAHWATGTPLPRRVLDILPDACSVLCGRSDGKPPELLPYLLYAFRNNTWFQPETIADVRGRIERHWIHRRKTLRPLEPSAPESLVEQLDLYLDELQALRPNMIRGLPVFLVWLADRARERGLCLEDVVAVLPFGGLCSEAMARRIEHGFGAPFRDVYGTGELGIIGASCRYGGGVHVFEDLFHVEILQGDHVAPPGELGRVVVTDLVNRAMPLIRYEVGDVARLDMTPCRCGLVAPRLHIEGRQVELLNVRNGERSSPQCFTARRLLNFSFAHEEIANARFDQSGRGRIRATFVPRSGKEVPVERLRVELERLFGPATPVRVRSTSFIRPEASGKYRIAQSEAPVEL